MGSSYTRFIESQPREVADRSQCPECFEHVKYVMGVAFDSDGIYLAWKCPECGNIDFGANVLAPIYEHLGIAQSRKAHR